MKTFVLMTRMAHQGADIMEVATKLKNRAQQQSKWLQKVKERCPQVHWLAHYALLGQWDFMDIYEAPDVETAHKVSLISRAGGALYAESWQAMPYENFLKILEQVSQ